MFSGVAGDFRLLLLTAFFKAMKVDKASIKGGSPTAFDLLTVFSMFSPFS